MQMSLLSAVEGPAQEEVPAGQLALSAVDEPRLAVLEGLLAGPGQMVRQGEAARISVVLPATVGDTAWRVEELLANFACLRLIGEVTSTVGGLTTVRSAFTPLLTPLATRWTRGAVQAPPADFRLDAAKLRMWAIAAGHWEGTSYQFGLAEHDQPAWFQVEKALKAFGLPATLVGHRAGGPALRITGRKRLAHLAEILGLADLSSAEN